MTKILIKELTRVQENQILQNEICKILINRLINRYLIYKIVISRLINRYPLIPKTHQQWCYQSVHHVPTVPKTHQSLNYYFRNRMPHMR